MSGATEKKQLFECTSPCKSCPYRKDAKLAFWSIEEFEHLLEAEADPLGAVYMCHQKNGSACIGWLMNQDERDLPSIALRLALLKHNVIGEYLDSLYCESEMFESVREMCVANFPELAGGLRR